MTLLPTQRTARKKRITDFTVLVYGPAKSGKSTFCSNAPDAIFLACEAGLNSLDVFQTAINKWDDIQAVYDELAVGGHGFQTVIIDTVDLMWQYCVDWGREKLGIIHESDAGFGKGYTFIREEFGKQMAKFASLPTGLIIVSHSQLKEMDTRWGKKTKTVPSLPNRAGEIIINMADVIMLVDLVDTQDDTGKAVTQRLLRCSPTASYEAGDKTGHLPDTLELDYHKVAAAFAAGGVIMNPISPLELCVEITEKMDEAVKAAGIKGLAAIWQSENINWQQEFPDGVGEVLFAEKILPYKEQLKACTNGTAADVTPVEEPEEETPAEPEEMASEDPDPEADECIVDDFDEAVPPDPEPEHHRVVKDDPPKQSAPPTTNGSLLPDDAPAKKSAPASKKKTAKAKPNPKQKTAQEPAKTQQAADIAKGVADRMAQ